MDLDGGRFIVLGTDIYEGEVSTNINMHLLN